MRDNAEIFADSLREYAEKGWKAIPVVVFQAYDKDGRLKREKAPLVDWRKYQAAAPTPEEIEKWASAPFARFAGVELLTGRYDANTVVCGLDFDQRDGRPDFNAYVDNLAGAMHTRTASGGWHYYCRHDSELSNATNIFHGDKLSDATIVDFRGQGGVIVVGPTPLWSADPRSFPEEDVSILARYETPEIHSPSDLLPIPPAFVVALNARATVGEKKWKQLYSEDAKTAPRHEIVMSLVAKLLTGVTEPEHVAGARKIVDVIVRTQFGDRFDSGEGREEIDRMFDYTIAKEKKRRSPEFDAAKDALADAETAPAAAEWTENFRPIRAELRDDLVTYFDADGARMDMQAKDRLSVSVFRNLHHLAYGVMLPTIPKNKFEKFIVAVPISRISDQSNTLEEILEDVLSDLSSASSPLESEHKAAKTASARDSASYVADDGSRVLFFRLRTLVQPLHVEGVRPRRSDITSALRALDAEVVKRNNCNLWKYVSSPVEDDRSPEAV